MLLVSSTEEGTVEDVTRQLELLKVFNSESDRLDEMIVQLHETLRFCRVEGDNIKQYSQEMQKLEEEKRFYVEKLRQIHADMNLLETTMKHAMADRQRMLRRACQLHQEYADNVSAIKEVKEMVGFPVSDDESELENLRHEVLEVVSNEPTGVVTSTNMNDPSGSSPVRVLNTGMSTSGHVPLFPAAAVESVSLATCRDAEKLATFRKSAGRVPDLLGGVLPNNPNAGALFPASLLQSGSFLSSSASSGNIPGVSNSNLAPSATTAVNQPPPMKTCQSCQQQIHRNAPICPLCKAKSRSRNPKKPRQRPPPPQMAQQQLHEGTANAGKTD